MCVSNGVQTACACDVKFAALVGNSYFTLHPLYQLSLSQTYTNEHTLPAQLPFSRCLLALFDVSKKKLTVSTTTQVDTNVIFTLLCL